MIPRFAFRCAAIVGALALMAGGCAPEAEQPPVLGARVSWLNGTPSVLPDDLEAIRIVLLDEDGSFRDTTVSVGNLDEDADGRPFLNHPLLSNLPTGRPIRVTIEGTNAGGALEYIGHVGPVVLSPGERRYVDLMMYPVGSPVMVASADVSGRLLPSVTALPDGRVLVAGGFDSVDPMSSCPAGTAAEARCFEIDASSDAFVFDPPTGKIFPVAGGMLEARGGHTATLLPGGRVLLAGGAARMMLILTPLDPLGFDFAIAAMQGDGSPGALATFEVFLPNANAEEDDIDRDGDAGRGGFVGSADDPAVPGRLGHERFMHAAAIVPGNPERVLLAGGLSSDGGTESWEVYDDLRPGGYGVYDSSGNALVTPRAMPGAAALTVPDGGSIWIVGGTAAFGNADLAEIWTPVDGDPNGMVVNANTTVFPAMAEGETDPRPEYATLAPSVAALGGGTHAIVIGWAGARCVPGTSTPTFPTMPDLSDTLPCGHDAVPRALLIDGTTGAAYPQTTGLGPHAFGDVAELSDGSVAAVSGIARIDWQPQPVVNVFTGDVAGTSAATGPSAMLLRGRAFHRSAAVPDRGIFTIGGLTIVGTPPSISPLSAAEMLYLERGPLTQP